MPEPNWLENPSVCAAQYVVGQSGSLNGQDIARRLQSVLLDLALALEDEGCRLIGHVKALAQALPRGHLYASLVSLERGVSLRGELPAGLQEARLTFNIIAYGVDQSRLLALLDQCVLKRFPEAARG